jgi:hypothetical protein
VTGLTTFVAYFLGAGFVVFPPPLLEDLAKALDRDENGTGTRNGYRIRVAKRDIISDTDTGILFVGTDTGITRILNLGYG